MLTSSSPAARPRSMSDPGKSSSAGARPTTSQAPASGHSSAPDSAASGSAAPAPASGSRASADTSAMPPLPAIVHQLAQLPPGSSLDAAATRQAYADLAAGLQASGSAGASEDSVAAVEVLLPAGQPLSYTLLGTPPAPDVPMSQQEMMQALVAANSAALGLSAEYGATNLLERVRHTVTALTTAGEWIRYLARALVLADERARHPPTPEYSRQDVDRWRNERERAVRAATRLIAQRDTLTQERDQAVRQRDEALTNVAALASRLASSLGSPTEVAGFFLRSASFRGCDPDALLYVLEACRRGDTTGLCNVNCVVVPYPGYCVPPLDPALYIMPPPLPPSLAALVASSGANQPATAILAGALASGPAISSLAALSTSTPDTISSKTQRPSSVPSGSPRKPTPPSSPPAGSSGASPGDSASSGSSSCPARSTSSQPGSITPPPPGASSSPTVHHGRIVMRPRGGGDDGDSDGEDDGDDEDEQPEFGTGNSDIEFNQGGAPTSSSDNGSEDEREEKEEAATAEGDLKRPAPTPLSPSANRQTKRPHSGPPTPAPQPISTTSSAAGASPVATVAAPSGAKPKPVRKKKKAPPPMKFSDAENGALEVTFPTEPELTMLGSDMPRLHPDVIASRMPAVPTTLTTPDKRMEWMRHTPAYKAELPVLAHARRGIPTLSSDLAEVEFKLVWSTLHFPKGTVMGTNRVLNWAPVFRTGVSALSGALLRAKLNGVPMQRENMAVPRDKGLPSSPFFSTLVVSKSASSGVVRSYGAECGADIYQELMDLELWEEVYKYRVTQIWTFDPTTLKGDSQEWLVVLLLFGYRFQQVFWEHLHWFHTGTKIVDQVASWTVPLKRRDMLSKFFSFAWLCLWAARPKSWPRAFDDLLVCEPAFWFRPALHCTWVPDMTRLQSVEPGVDRSRILRQQLGAIDEEEPIRSFYAGREDRCIESLKVRAQMAFRYHHYLGVAWSVPDNWLSPDYPRSEDGVRSLGTPGPDFYKASYDQRLLADWVGRTQKIAEWYKLNDSTSGASMNDAIFREILGEWPLASQAGSSSSNPPGVPASAQGVVDLSPASSSQASPAPSAIDLSGDSPMI